MTSDDTEGGSPSSPRHIRERTSRSIPTSFRRSASPLLCRPFQFFHLLVCGGHWKQTPTCRACPVFFSCRRERGIRSAMMVVNCTDQVPQLAKACANQPRSRISAPTQRAKRSSTPADTLVDFWVQGSCRSSQSVLILVRPSIRATSRGPGALAVCQVVQ